ncbi:electron transfer flavoprotein-ubiquinone oxidoreductase [Paraferrimonas sedimenticola]|uniref:Electron transfer flavoprotein-ubiquinone oxidoreductase n=1 Tax=Paraferrimonas sedimenticola TaxID=375674 RepID=A0AA37RUF6_9GAMM|nr:electron transfer flavoprotein-ubiquinone oxidoreductase [Paraferrimonas sedimenticola]GLP95389.1 electron transfer flavoprotein-ubiquinone oxidoreductase [Paraferrimonas sedimenticola]
MERESMEFDVVVVGAGPSGLATAIRLAQLAQEQSAEVSICVVEKGSEVGAHILSGAVFETRALDELLPNWAADGAPVTTQVTGDEIYLLKSDSKAAKFSNTLVPKTMHNEGNYIISLGNLCRWLGEQAEALGVEIFPGFTASELLKDEQGRIKGVLTGDMGVGADGSEKDGYMPGMELLAKHTVFAEGCRGHLGKQLIADYQLDAGKMPQHYGIGFKEIWQIDADKHELGKVVHTGGWPLEGEASGGGYLYHIEGNQVVLGLIIDLNYKNPNISPYDEFQRYKTHPLIKNVIEGGERISYGARAIAKGGLSSLPQMTLPGGILVGCDAGTLNFAKIKGSHTAMKSGMLAAESIFAALQAGEADLSKHQKAFEDSWLYDELYRARNFGAAMHKFGTTLGGAFNFIDQNWFGGKLPVTLKDDARDEANMQKASEAKAIEYPKYDGKITFDKMSSVYLTNTYHEEDQPSHLRLSDPDIPLKVNFVEFNEPAQRYCPAGVYEVVEEGDERKFVVNSQNCIHCKTCDIKDPSQNITWVTPEGGGGPNYTNM